MITVSHIAMETT